MPHQIFNIDELLRLVITELVITSPRTAVSFALARRSFEEPTLSSLWEKQHSLTVLVKVIPNHTWVRGEHGVKSIAIEHDPSPEDWTRLRRYASWTHRLNLDFNENLTSDTLSQLSCNSPGGLLCPKLDHLFWGVSEAGIPLEFLRLFISPNLKILTLCGIPNPFLLDQLEPLAQIISLLPTSLQYLIFMWGQGKEFFQDAISSFVCQRGSSMISLCTNAPLSETALLHLVQLPNLRHWSTSQAPPRTIPTSVFPPLAGVHLDRPAALPWLHLLASHGKSITQSGNTMATSHTNVRETLKSLRCPWGTTIESTLLSSITSFRNLVRLHADSYCARSCTFRLTDDDTKDLASVLPRLESLQLGLPCRFDSCNTTVTSLLSLSVHCPGLKILEIHFNTGTIIRDTRRLLDEGVGHEKARCMVSELSVGHLQATIPKKDIENVAMGLKVIFPHLKNLLGKYGPRSKSIYEIVD